MKIIKAVAPFLALVLCLTACASKVKLNANGSVDMDYAKTVAAEKVDKYCKKNNLPEYKIYSAFVGENYPDVADDPNDIIINFNDTGVRKLNDGAPDVSGDIVVYVSRDGKTVKIIGVPGNNPLDRDAASS